MFNASIKDRNSPYKKITQELLEATISQKSPSVSSRDLREYERIRNEFAPKEGGKSVSIGFR